MLLRASGAVIALALLAPQPALAQPAGGRVRMIANPSALIGVDIATAQAMRAKGAREGLAGSMAGGAEVVVPPRQAAEPLLRRKEGAPLHPHQPDAAWIACDGSYGITRGRWTDGAQSGGQSGGWYATVWQRHPKKGYYQWRLTLEGAAASLPDAPEFLVGLVADCPARAGPGGGDDRPPAKPAKNAPVVQRALAGPIPADDAPAGSDSQTAQSNDGSLAWRATVRADGSRAFRAWQWKDGAMAEIVHLDAPASPGQGG
ncbi:hypothetical protein [Novosphingobium pokkalii]|uniref:Uncharacterized protein n=1 Tax=Novosphingobium pokkalii TaxID=1770194 RepID=A0ABV7V836_9SPHN|nr:hypothetical protein [Novosphingobium pokkalii]GHC85848.1 hypothetical protein GCM10019060_06950 [Novosphingobium pokkalii]